MSIFKACDIRGIVGEELTEGTARRIGRSLGGMIRRRGNEPVCLAGDFRRTTSAIKQALLHGLLDAGALVRDVGQVPTPVAYFAARHLQCPNVAIVTASHNPGRYNGVKFMLAGRPAVPELMNELQAGLDAPLPSVERGTVTPADATDAWQTFVRTQTAAIVPAPIAGLRIVLDAMGGAFTAIAPRLLAAEGCRVRTMGDDIDPDFANRPPNPAVEDNLRALCQRMTAEPADLGIALDGDGDRVALVDHIGRIARPEQIGALLIQRCFPRATVVYDQKCASILADAARAAGGTAIMQSSGYGFIKTTMIDRQADLGVEVSGHYFFKPLGGGDDGLFAALLVAHVLAAAQKPLAELISAIPWPVITPDLRIPFRGDANAVLNRIAETCAGHVSRLDGVRAEYEDGWALARASITEPLMTLRFEGRDRESLRRIITRFLAAVPDLHGKVMENIDA